LIGQLQNGVYRSRENLQDDHDTDETSSSIDSSHFEFDYRNGAEEWHGIDNPEVEPIVSVVHLIMFVNNNHVLSGYCGDS
jgi:hypothetical protein